MKIDYNIILNVLIAMAFYKIVVQLLAGSLFKVLFQGFMKETETGKKMRKSFNERLEEKLKEQEGS